MFFQQTFAALGRALPAVIAPTIITDLRMEASWIGVYFGVMALAALVTQLGCGSFIVRHGALRVSQISLVMLGAGCALLTLGTPLPLLLSAVIGGGGGAVATPASSHLLSRVIGEDAVVTDRNIDVHVRALRQKLGDARHHVETVVGVGYRFVIQPPAEPGEVESAPR